jgi:VanZ family protein
LHTGFKEKMSLVAFRLVSWSMIAVCLWMIHGFSQQDASRSDALSLEVTDVVARVLKPEGKINRSSGSYQKLHDHVRKGAHTMEYALLAMAALLALTPSRIRPALQPLIVLLFCFAFAGYDEWSQTMSLGRSPAFRDVAIDTAGALLGCLAMLFLRWMAVWALRAQQYRQQTRR